jgi:uncharacterized RDD family membrane protein YckC
MPPQLTPNAENAETATSVPALSESREASVQSSEGLIEPGTPCDPDAWRGELSARLTRYRARRKIPPPRYPSLNLQFGPLDPVTRTDLPRIETPPASYQPMSEQALALDESGSDSFTSGVAPTVQAPVPVINPVAPPSAKIIEFPRFAWAPPPPPPDQLAEPVGTAPRILEVPESAPPPPALGGITIEPAQQEEVERRPGIDIPLRSAPLGRRMIASALDSVIVLLACALFGGIFWKITGLRPPLTQVLGLVAGVPTVLWAVYQYLLIVYSGSTPGLRIAKLDLSRFDGTKAPRALRRWRVLGSYLSAASLGMGYAWVFLDEDALCWHDRITHTYLAPRLIETDRL